MAIGDNLVEYFKLDEASGNRVGSHAGLVLTDTGSTPAGTGLSYGNAAFFNEGAGQKLVRADEALMSAGDIDFTLFVAFYMSTPPAYNWELIRKVDGAAFEYQIEKNSSNLIDWYIWNSSGSFQTVSSAVISAFTWYGFFAWHDAVNNIQGCALATGASVAAAVTSAWTTGVRDSTSNFQVGDNALNAYVGPVVRWNRVLDSTDRTTFWNSGTPLTYAQMFPASTSGAARRARYRHAYQYSRRPQGVVYG